MNWRMCQSWSCTRGILALLLLATHVLGSNILSVLATFDELSTLNFHLNASSTLSAALTAANNFTFVAPSNAAFDAYLISISPTTPTAADYEKLLSYHFLFGGWPGATFTQNSQFVPTNLTSGTLANVTGGQVVELLADSSGKPQFLSGNKSVTTIAQQDILCVGGIIHIVDQVFQIPPSVVTLLTEAKLELAIALLSKAGLLSAANIGFVSAVFGVPDITVFIPNSQKAISSLTSMIAGESSSQNLSQIFNYHQVTNFVGYSNRLTDGMKLKTGEGENVIVTIQGNKTFIDGAQIISSDFLIGNGVMHVIDDTLNPFNITTPPAATSTSTTSTTSKSYATLSIGVTFAFLFPVCAGIFIFWALKRRAQLKNLQSQLDQTLAREDASERRFQRNVATMSKKDYELEDSSPVVGPGFRPSMQLPPPSKFKPYRTQSYMSAVELDAGSVHQSRLSKQKEFI